LCGPEQGMRSQFGWNSGAWKPPRSCCFQTGRSVRLENVRGRQPSTPRKFRLVNELAVMCILLIFTLQMYSTLWKMAAAGKRRHFNCQLLAGIASTSRLAGIKRKGRLSLYAQPTEIIAASHRRSDSCWFWDCQRWMFLAVSFDGTIQSRFSNRGFDPVKGPDLKSKHS